MVRDGRSGGDGCMVHHSLLLAARRVVWRGMVGQGVVVVWCTIACSLLLGGCYGERW